MGNNAKIFMKSLLKSKETGIFLILIVLSVLIQMNNPIFFTFGNIMDILRNTSYTLIIAIGMTFVLIIRGLDLSVGSLVAFCGLSAALCMQRGVPVIVSILLGLFCGAVFGGINAFGIVKLKIPAMIATLGAMYMGRGLVLVITKGQAVYPLPDSFTSFGKGNLLGVPNVVILAFILAVIAHFVLSRTTYGRKVYAIGGNPETAGFAGISVSKIQISVYIISGVMAALSGIMTAARMGSGQPSVGDGIEMMVITAVIIGGTSLNGGAGTILGTVFGTLLMNVLSSGMNLVGVSAYWQKFVMGLIIIIAVGFDQYQRSKRRA
ncbi:MAG: ABC transporter permease [Lacrimispora sp.]|uniref:ABC transporter permease n=1 Tax=Lacrimispora sp. TaxID=2719234 RepID=UPI0039E55333